MLPTRKRRISNDYSARVHPVMRGTHYRTRQHMNQFTHKQQWRWQNVFRASPSIERIGASQASEATVTQTPLSTRVTIPLDASTVEVLVETVAVTKNTNNANMTNMVDADPAPVTAPVLAAKLMGKRWSDGDIQTNPEPFLESTSAKNLRPRSVSFLPTVEVTLIPCRREYKEAQVFDDVWWRDLDYSAFKAALLGDFLLFLKQQHMVLQGGALGRKVALKLFIEHESRA